jgi:predicted metalloprotease
LHKGLDDGWKTLLGSQATGFTSPTIDVGDDNTSNRCRTVPKGALRVAFYCAPTNTIVASDKRLRQLYQQFGDNAVGMVLAESYADAVQHSLGSTLTGERRALASDCLSGAWTASLFPDPGVAKDVTISAGDLDEAIQTLIAIGDPTQDTNLRGSPFEKIGAFRKGVLDGLDACRAQLKA